MKVQEFSETDILNYLMSSEFNEGLSPDEFKFLLYKFRYNYRLIYAKNESMSTKLEKALMDLGATKFNFEKNINNLNSEKVEAEKKFEVLKNRKLSWRERIKGKIIFKEDEIKRL
jgi:hypothetical protein